LLKSAKHLRHVYNVGMAAEVSQVLRWNVRARHRDSDFENYSRPRLACVYYLGLPVKCWACCIPA
jgi:hypothetical protein